MVSFQRNVSFKNIFQLIIAILVFLHITTDILILMARPMFVKMTCGNVLIYEDCKEFKRAVFETRHFSQCGLVYGEIQRRENPFEPS